MADFYFGKGTCEICLEGGATMVRYLPKILVDDVEVKGGYQNVHKDCYVGLLEALGNDKARHQAGEKPL